MSRLAIGLLAALILSCPLAQAQTRSGSVPAQTSGGGVVGGGPIYYPGFGWSSHPLNTPIYGPGYAGPGYTGGYGYGYAAPIVTAPVAVPGVSGYFRIGGARINYWQAPSGYYYPWGLGTTYTTGSPIYIVQQGQTQPQAPPLSSMFSDMESYVDDCQKKGKLTQIDYQRLFRRLQDLRSKFDHQRSAAGGTLDAGDEESIRRDVDNLGGEIARAVKPIK